MSLGLALALQLTLAAAPRVAVMPICAGEAISEKSVDSLTQVLAAELRAQSGASVITARDLASILSLEKQKQMLGCTTESCMAEIAGAVGADRVVAGDVAKLEKSLLSWPATAPRVRAPRAAGPARPRAGAARRAPR